MRRTVWSAAGTSAGAVKLMLALVSFCFAPLAHAQIYKCTDADGKATYADAPCDARSKPLRLPSDSKGNTTDPNMCAQLLDETHRLAAEAERASKSGRAPRADADKRRQSLARQYEARCAGIARSGAASR